jgi:hypothetical protein
MRRSRDAMGNSQSRVRPRFLSPPQKKIHTTSSVAAEAATERRVTMVAVQTHPKGCSVAPPQMT